jgi:hypothetical protein
MSETLRVGDSVVRRCADGSVDAGVGVGIVTASDVSHVHASFANDQLRLKVNAGTLALGDGGVLSLLTESDAAELRAFQGRIGLINEVRSLLDSADIARLQSAKAAITSGSTESVPICHTCTFWRPPYDDYGPGNCHNQTVREFTRMGHETYPPPTPPEFGCNQWKAKQQPENGDDSDE